MRLGVALCALALAGIGPGLPARAQVRHGMRAELGAEYDSNPGRAERVEGDRDRPVVGGSALGRLVVTADVAAAIGERHALTLAAGLAGKLFQRAEARSEDVVVAEASGGWAVRVGDRTRLALAGNYYDVFQRASVEARNFRYSTAALRLDRAVGEGGALALGVGHRWFRYKPEPELDFAGPTAFALVRWQRPGQVEGEADWEWSASAGGELRAFVGHLCTANACPDRTQGARRDQFLTLQLEGTRTGAFLAGAGLGVHGNLSNSYGDQLVRGLVHLRAGFLLPAELTLSGRAELVVTRYRDQVPLVPDIATGTARVSIEDEGRSTLRLELARRLGDHWDLGVRYTLYANESSSGAVHYRRQTALLFLATER